VKRSINLAKECVLVCQCQAKGIDNQLLFVFILEDKTVTKVNFAFRCSELF
jgi:hypothetical protein